MTKEVNMAREVDLGVVVPSIGANGNWYMGDVDLGKPSQGVQGPAGAKGDTGEQGPQGPVGPARQKLSSSPSLEIWSSGTPKLFQISMVSSSSSKTVK